MEYHDSERAAEMAARTREFVDEVVIPREREYLGDGPIPGSVIAELQADARERDLYAPQIPEEYGGQGLDFRDMLPVFEAAGRSLVGAHALRIAAPDEGNMHTLEQFGTADQKERWMQPLVDGEIFSAFSMTEPHDGAGSDPKMLRTTAERDGDEWVINGHKWWTTQGSEADLLIVFARTDEDRHPYAGSSTFLVPADADGVEIVRDIPHIGGDMTGQSHAEIVYDDVRIPAENLLGELNEGFTVVQQRLGPARTTHCMRFSGMAERALDVAKAYMAEREAFGTPLEEKQALRHRLADAEIQLHAARTMIRHAAEAIAEGKEARVEVGMSKVFAANAFQEVIDEALQFTGGMGISRDLPLSYFYDAVRQFRIIDGADEVHRRVIARNALEDIDASELETITRYGEPRRVE
ncbi:MAG: acyl-CoA dehydrogenase family protein [Halodesulfurarchaeum sp.]